MNNYSNPMVTYNEIIEALKAILESSKTNGYLDDYSFLNVRYDVLNKSPLYEEQEQALIQAIQSLEKTIEAADKVIRENLKSVLDEIAASNLFMIPTKYKKDEEYRKLAAQSEFVMKLREMSLPLEILSTVPKVEEKEQIDEIEELINPPEEVQVEEIPALEEEEKVDYYSRVKLGNVKNAFAVTEEQYEKLKTFVKEDVKEEIGGLDIIIPEENNSLEDIEAVAEVVPTEEIKEAEIPTIEEEESPLIVGDITMSDIPMEKTKEEPQEIVEEPVIEETKEETTKEAPEEVVVEEEPKKEKVSAKSEKVEAPKKEEKKLELSEEKKNSMNRIQLIKKALDKAKEKENTQLVTILEQQLKKEIEIFKS